MDNFEFYPVVTPVKFYSLLDETVGKRWDECVLFERVKFAVATDTPEETFKLISKRIEAMKARYPKNFRFKVDQGKKFVFVFASGPFEF